MKKLISKLYILAFMMLTVLFSYVIWEVTFNHILEEYHSRQIIVEEKKKEQKEQTVSSFKKAIMDDDERVKHYLGYRVLEEQKIEGHFHHIDFDFKKDKRSYCVECHGDMPHDKVKELRAFGNMHASFISCQTCHVKFSKKEKTGIYKWYNRVTGEIVPSPVREGVNPGAYDSKIIPFSRVNGKLQRIDTQDHIDFTSDYRKNEASLSDVQKSKAKKIIHKIISEKPHMCEDCHQKANPLLPFEYLGYSKKRTDVIVSTEVVGMIKNYTKFYMPRILHPGFGDEK